MRRYASCIFLACNCLGSCLSFAPVSVRRQAILKSGDSHDPARSWRRIAQQLERRCGMTLLWQMLLRRNRVVHAAHGAHRQTARGVARQCAHRRRGCRVSTRRALSGPWMSSTRKLRRKKRSPLSSRARCANAPLRVLPRLLRRTKRRRSLPGDGGGRAVGLAGLFLLSRYFFSSG